MTNNMIDELHIPQFVLIVHQLPSEQSEQDESQARQEMQEITTASQARDKIIMTINYLSGLIFSFLN